MPRDEGKGNGMRRNTREGDGDGAMSQRMEFRVQSMEYGAGRWSLPKGRARSRKSTDYGVRSTEGGSGQKVKRTH
jgi:hypothetical protein